MFVEQALHACQACSQAFAAQFSIEAADGTRVAERRLRKVWVRCPRRECARSFPILVPAIAGSLVVKAIPGADRRAHAPDPSLQHLWASVSVERALGGRGERAKAAFQAMLRWACVLSYGWPLLTRI